jgi:ketosteroid isomerase-like protein
LGVGVRIALLFGVAAAAFCAPEDVLIQADRQFAQITAQKGAEGFVSFFDEHGTILPKNGDPISGPQDLLPVFQKTWSAHGGYSLEWTPMKAVLAKSGDLGYTYGSYVRKFVKDGQPATETGKYVTIWKKQPDGSWKVLLDMGN